MTCGQGDRILLSSLGSVGVIADKAGQLPKQTGWPFWGSAILLIFGILSQVANQFRVTQRAADSESLALRCGLCETRLNDMLMEDDPQTAVAELFVEVSTLFQTERYHVVLPKEADKFKDEARRRADDLIARNRGYWQLKVIKQRGLTRRSTPPPASDVERQVNPEPRQNS